MSNPTPPRMVRMVDPPAGRAFGFPCELPEGKDYAELLREHSYPSDLMVLALEHSRYWEVPSEV